MEQLNNRLQVYTYHGVPKVHPHLTFDHDSWEEEEVEPDLTLEDRWQQLLENPEVTDRCAQNASTLVFFIVLRIAIELKL